MPEYIRGRGPLHNDDLDTWSPCGMWSPVSALAERPGGRVQHHHEEQQSPLMLLNRGENSEPR